MTWTLSVWLHGPGDAWDLVTTLNWVYNPYWPYMATPIISRILSLITNTWTPISCKFMEEKALNIAQNLIILHTTGIQVITCNWAQSRTYDGGHLHKASKGDCNWAYMGS